MKRICITGHTHGIGKILFDYYLGLGWDVVGFSRSEGFDIIKNFDQVVSLSKGADIFVNHTYDSTAQLDLLNALHKDVKKMIVFGSVAADFPDPNSPLPDYSRDKKILETRCWELSNTKFPGYADILFLKLSSNSYKDTSMVLDTIDLWIKHPTIISVGFNVSQ